MKKIYLLLFLCGTLFACEKDDDVIQETQFNYTQNQFQRDGLTLNWETNVEFNQDIKKRLVDTYFAVYTNIYTYFNPASKKVVTFRINKDYNGVAYADWQAGIIVFGSAYMTANPNDNDVVTHELTHIAQSYPKYEPVWLVEGIADYSRNLFGINNPSANWNLPAVTANQNYTDSYRVTARFLVWVETKIKVGTVKYFDAKLRAGTYTEADWTIQTGKTVQELWTQYKANPAL